MEHDRDGYMKFSQAYSGPPLWETVGMKKPELTDIAWLGPKEEMDRASHRVGKCSECLEIICVEKAVAETESTNQRLRRSSTKHFVHTSS
jgi:hypothetical protein